jgi:hypothetical protein
MLNITKCNFLNNRFPSKQILFSEQGIFAIISILIFFSIEEKGA